MRGTRLGPYRIETELGSGGMGTVHAGVLEGDVQGLESGRRVAIKIIHPHLLDRPEYVERFRREAEIGRQVDHPNVVRTLDAAAAEVDGKTAHFLVTELVEGRSLRTLLHDLGTVPEGLLREIGRQVAAGLAAVHEAGIVHRDLKPENVLITDDHQIRIMDLGVARIVEQSISLTRQGEFAGSLLYAAPEQFEGDRVGPPADLYALGVLLYELATGIHPFRHDDVSRVIAAHIRDVPAPVSDLAPETSPFLGELITSLLAKRAEDRGGPAAWVRDLLEQGEDAAWWHERRRDLLERRPRLLTVPIRRETALHGRGDELASLTTAWAEARQGQGRTVLLEGEAGIGKTRLVDALLESLGEDDAHVLYGAYTAGGLGGLSESILEAFGGADLEDRLAPYLTATPRLLGAFTALVRHEAPAAGAERIRGEALHAVLCHFLRALAAEKPVLWIVEDIHLAEPESLHILLSLARALEGHRAMLLLTTEAGLPDALLADLGRLEGCRRQALGRLSPREVVTLLREAFRSEALADRLGARIAYKSDGVPYFVFEIVRGLRESGSLQREDDGTWVAAGPIQEIEVPSTVRDLVDARLGRLERDERAILDVAAVQGDEFDTRLIAAVLERRRVAVLQDLAEIERHTGVIRSDGGRCRFDHHLVREVLYQDLMPELRTEYHSMLAEAMADREGERPSADLPPETVVFLASHHLRGSRPARGLPCLLPALGHLARSYRGESALEMAERALAIDGLLSGAQRLDVLFEQARHLDLLGRRTRQREALEEARVLAEELDDLGQRCEVYGGLGGLEWSTSRPEEAERWLGLSLDLARQLGDVARERRALGKLGNVYENLGRYDEAREHYEAAIAAARDLGSRAAEGTISGNLGVLLLNRGRVEDARVLFEQHREIALEGDDRREVGMSATNLAIVALQLGHYEEASRFIEESLTMSREIGDRQMEGVATGNLGEILLHLGRTAEAMEQHRRCRSIARDVGDRLGEGIAQLNLGPLRAMLGDPVRAEWALEEAEAIFQETGARREETYALHALGEVAEMRGEVDEAARRYGLALARRRELRYRSGVAATLTAMGRLDLDADRPDDARRRLDEAIETAGEIEDGPALALALAIRAWLSDGDAEVASDALRRAEGEMSHTLRLATRHALWRATGDAEHLEEARRLLDELRARAPRESRESMVAQVPMHREIAAAAGS